MGSKRFWYAVKPFLISKGFIHKEKISTEIEVKNTSGKTPTILVKLTIMKLTLTTIIDKFKNHPGINTTKNEFPATKNLNIEAATVDQITKIIRGLDPKKATGPEKMPVKVVKMSANIMEEILTDIINNDLLRNSFSDSAKIA